MNLKKSKFLIVGQLKTSRTEALEKYFVKKAGALCIIGVMSPFARHNESRCTLYQDENKVKEFLLPAFNIKNNVWWARPLMCISFGIYIFSVLLSILRLKIKFDVFIGVATFSSMLGLLLKKFGIVKQVVYYCLDYYPPPKKDCFNKFVNLIYKHIDKWIVKNVDVLWEISPRIKEGRERYSGMSIDSYKQIIVPLGYSENNYKFYSLKEREPWTLGFVGTLSENQGLQMVIKAMPELVKRFPEIKVRVIGHGPFAAMLKKLVDESNMQGHFIFHGFVRNNDEVNSILSRCMAGLATWTGDETDNSLYADPGKPKLYALLGLPIIITRAPYVAGLIKELGAGEVIGYNESNFIDAVSRIFEGENRFENYINGLRKMRPYCMADIIFDKAVQESFN